MLLLDKATEIVVRACVLVWIPGFVLALDSVFTHAQIGMYLYLCLTSTDWSVLLADHVLCFTKPWRKHGACSRVCGGINRFHITNRQRGLV